MAAPVDADWANNELSDGNLNKTTHGSGTTATRTGLSSWPADRPFFDTDEGKWYYNSHASAPSSVIWSLLGGDTSNIYYKPLSTTIGDYSQPSSAVSSSVGSGNVDYQQLFDSSPTGWSTSDAGEITIGGGEIQIRANGGDATHENAGWDISHVDEFGADPNATKWTLDFKVDITALTTGLGQNGFEVFLGLFAGNVSFGSSKTGIAVRLTGSNAAGAHKQIILQTLDGDTGAGTQRYSAGTNSLTVAMWYFRLIRMTSNTFRLLADTDPTFATPYDSGTIDIGTNTISSLDDIVCYVRKVATNSHSFNADVFTMNFYDNTDKGIDDFEEPYVAANAVDDDTATRAETQTENTPSIYFDLNGANLELASVAINFDKTNTTETEVTLSWSTDTTFSGEIVRTLQLSEFSDDTYLFIPIPRQVDDRRYLEIKGTSNNVKLAINEVKYLAKTTAEWDRSHDHSGTASE